MVQTIFIVATSNIHDKTIDVLIPKDISGDYSRGSNNAILLDSAGSAHFHPLELIQQVYDRGEKSLYDEILLITSEEIYSKTRDFLHTYRHCLDASKLHLNFPNDVKIIFLEKQPQTAARLSITPVTQIKNKLHIIAA